MVRPNNQAASPATLAEGIVVDWHHGGCELACLPPSLSRDWLQLAWPYGTLSRASRAGEVLADSALGPHVPAARIARRARRRGSAAAWRRSLSFVRTPALPRGPFRVQRFSWPSARRGTVAVAVVCRRPYACGAVRWLTGRV